MPAAHELKLLQIAVRLVGVDPAGVAGRALGRTGWEYDALAPAEAAKAIEAFKAVVARGRVAAG